MLDDISIFDLLIHIFPFSTAKVASPIKTRVSCYL
jgi:hypothetical protein